MTKILTTAQVESYTRDGFVYPVDVMTADEGQSYLSRLEVSEALQGKALVKGSNFKPHLLFKWADELAYHPTILDAVEDLIGTDIRILSSTVFPKSPGEGTFVDWHQDGTYFALQPDNVQVAVWLALSDAPVESGCMEMAVGSHRLGQLSHAEVSSEKHMLSLGQTVNAPFSKENTQFMPLKAGQMSLHHTHTAHRSGPNMAPFRRVGVTLTYVPAYAAVRAKVRPSAALVRGDDRWHNFEDEPRPVTDFGAAEQAFQQRANSLFRGVYDEERLRYNAVNL
jgi:non-heme Fe2+,alpha-ketoglutarate-dependent halogenase